MRLLARQHDEEPPTAPAITSSTVDLRDDDELQRLRINALHVRRVQRARAFRRGLEELGRRQ